MEVLSMANLIIMIPAKNICQLTGGGVKTPDIPHNAIIRSSNLT